MIESKRPSSIWLREVKKPTASYSYEVSKAVPPELMSV